MHRTVKEIEPWGILIAVVALVLSLTSIWIDYADRVEERTVRAWQLLTTRAPGNSGKIAALQYLNREDGLLCADALRGRLWWLRGDDNVSCLISHKAPTPLTGIDLSPPADGTPDDLSDDPPGAYLREVDLRGADLIRADLIRADLSSAKLSGADLSGADLSGAKLLDAGLSGADLSGANLSHADLNGAVLKEANLRGADLSGAKLLVGLSGADLSDAVLSGTDPTDALGLVQEQLDHACGDAATKLPEGLLIRRCPLHPLP